MKNRRTATAPLCLEGSRAPHADVLSAACSRRRRVRSWLAWPAAIVVAFLIFTPGAPTQYVIPPPPPPAPTGPTPGANLRQAASATEAHVNIVRKSAADWGRRAAGAGYGDPQFQQDFATVQFQFQLLRQQFAWLASLAQQLGQPRANNAMAELDAGLNIIGELFTFLASQYQAGTLDRQTIVRTCRALDNALREWDRELDRNRSRLGRTW